MHNSIFWIDVCVWMFRSKLPTTTNHIIKVCTRSGLYISAFSMCISFVSLCLAPTSKKRCTISYQHANIRKEDYLWKAIQILTPKNVKIALLLAFVFKLLYRLTIGFWSIISVLNRKWIAKKNCKEKTLGTRNWTAEKHTGIGSCYYWTQTMRTIPYSHTNNYRFLMAFWHFIWPTNHHMIVCDKLTYYSFYIYRLPARFCWLSSSQTFSS